MRSKNKVAFNLIVAVALVALIGILVWQLSAPSSANTTGVGNLPKKSSSSSKAGASGSVAIEIAPGNKTKAIDLGSQGKIEVAILGNPNFDVRTIDPASLNFAGASILKDKNPDNGAGEQNDLKAAPSAASGFDLSFKDSNGDGREDLVGRFSIPYLSQLSAGFHEAVVTGTTFGGSAFRGSDYVNAYGESVLKSTSSPQGLTGGNCNSTTITIPDSGTATPYPSDIAVSGFTGVVSNVTVTLFGFSHTFPSDVSVLLVGPTGQKVILMGRSGSGTDAVNATLTFDDAATAYLPAAIVTGTFKPTNLAGGGVVFPAPAPAVTPASPAAATLSAFNNTNPNGTWSLFVLDSAAGDMGQFSGGWCLNITTAPSVTACAPTLIQSTITGSDTTQTSRLFRNAVPSVCTGVPKTCPGPSGTATLHFKTFSITNNNTSTQCVTVTTTTACGVNVFVSAYLTSFDPANLCTNYLADSGSSPSGTGTATGTSMSFSVPAGATFLLHAVEISANIGCTGFSLLVEGNLCAPAGTCTLTCPANITVSTDPNLCSAVVNYPAPTPTGTCGTITCVPPSGSTFQKGVTPVNCTSSTGGGSCSFTVTVNDTQPPTITCPPGISAVVPNPGATCTTVTYCPPTVTDNCPGVTVVCVPPSGSCLPQGTTTVTCTATDTSNNTASCSFTITVFGICIQDDSDPTKVLLIITSGAQAGQYRFCCKGTTFTGTGTVKQIGSSFTFQHNPPDRRVQATYNIDTTSTASLQVPPGTNLCVITDKPNIGVHTCTCGSPGAGCVAGATVAGKQ